MQGVQVRELQSDDCAMDAATLGSRHGNWWWHVSNSIRKLLMATKIACGFGALCIAAIAIAFWQVAAEPTVAHPRSIMALGIASIGVFASLILFTAAQLIGAGRFR